MKAFIAFSALLALASASPLYLAPGQLIVPSVSSQYHSQDGIGQYAYGYNDLLSAKQEVKSLNGITKGSYSYIDSNNVLQTVDYIADAGGFRVTATNLPKPVEAPVVPPQNLPVQVADTVDVAAAKAAHFEAIDAAKKQNPEAIVVPASFDLPRPVEDTPEVAAAKALHLAAVEEAKKQTVLIPAPIELPRPVEDTPEVAKAKAEHLLALEQAKLGYSNLNGISLVQSSPLPLFASSLPITAYSTFPLSGGFSYTSSVVPTASVQYVRYL